MATKHKASKHKAKKDHTILQGDFRLEIKSGSFINLEEIPAQYHENLVTEGVIDSTDEK